MTFTQDAKSINRVLLEAARTSRPIADDVHIGKAYQKVMNDYFELKQ